MAARSTWIKSRTPGLELLDPRRRGVVFAIRSAAQSRRCGTFIVEGDVSVGDGAIKMCRAEAELLCLEVRGGYGDTDGQCPNKDTLVTIYAKLWWSPESAISTF